MKFALVFGLVLVVFWLWRSSRHGKARDEAQASQRQKPAALNKATEIVACRLCDVHLPRGEAVVSSRGMYCSEEHRQQAND